MHTDLKHKNMEQNKRDFFNNFIANKYKGIEDIISDEKYTTYDIVDFIRFRDSDKIKNTYQDWLAFKQIQSKISRVGINGVLMRSDVQGTHKAYDDDGRGKITKLIAVDTDYGSILVCADGRSIFETE